MSGIQMAALASVSGLSAPIASAAPSSVSGSGVGGSQTTDSTTCIASGGSGSFTYQWQLSSGEGFTITNPTGATTAFSKSGLMFDDPLTGDYFCRVTDTITGLLADSNLVSVLLSRL